MRKGETENIRGKYAPRIDFGRIHMGVLLSVLCVLRFICLENG